MADIEHDYESDPDEEHELRIRRQRRDDDHLPTMFAWNLPGPFVQYYNGKRMELGVKHWGKDNIYRRDVKGKFISTNCAKNPKRRRVADIEDLTRQLQKLLRKLNRAL